MADDMLLDGSRLEGPVALRRFLGPDQYAWAVDGASITDVSSVIEHICQLWGGFSHLPIPVTPDRTGLSDDWTGCVRNSEIEVIVGRSLLTEANTEGVHVRPEPPNTREALLSVLAAQEKSAKDLAVVDVSRLHPDDPYVHSAGLVRSVCLDIRAMASESGRGTTGGRRLNSGSHVRPNC
jgi:hypothetical protein